MYGTSSAQHLGSHGEQSFDLCIASHFPIQFSLRHPLVNDVDIRSTAMDTEIVSIGGRKEGTLNLQTHPIFVTGKGTLSVGSSKQSFDTSQDSAFKAKKISPRLS